MGLNITIRKVQVNEISTLGSLNVGKAVFIKNRSNAISLPKPFYEEDEFGEEELETLEEELEEVPDVPAFYHD